MGNFNRELLLAMVFGFARLHTLFKFILMTLLSKGYTDSCKEKEKNAAVSPKTSVYKAYAGQQLQISCDAYEMLIMNRRWNTSLPTVTWYKITDRLVEMEKFNESTELFRIHRFLSDGGLHIISVQPTLHSGRFYCEVTDASCNVYGSYSKIEVSVCKWRKKAYRGFCAFGVCKVHNNSLKHITMTCTCEPGYSGAFCTYRSPNYMEQMYIPWYPFVLFLFATFAIPIVLSILKAQSDKVRNFAKHLE